MIEMNLDNPEQHLEDPDSENIPLDEDDTDWGNAFTDAIAKSPETSDSRAAPQSVEEESETSVLDSLSQTAQKNMTGRGKGLYIAMFSIHGLVRGENMELGRDADTGGQVKYVVELARALAERQEIDRVDLFTRKVIDPKVDPSYSVPEEKLAENSQIIRLLCGPRRYLRKEVLWPYLDQFADLVLKHFRKIGRLPDFLHAHYADAGYVGTKLSQLLGIPLLFTGHSLGRVKKQRLLERGLTEAKIVQRYNINERIEAEENTLSTAVMVIASTNQEVEEQYKLYEQYGPERMVVIPPGIDVKRFRPPTGSPFNEPIARELFRFLQNPRKPMILLLSRADERKNITTLIRAYAEHPELRREANLILVAGTRDDIEKMEHGPQEVLKNILYLIDKYDLYGSVAYPKQHQNDDIPIFYRIAAKTKGVFVNPALTEPFGLTLLEAGASGIPVVATNDGGPIDITNNCQNGVLIDPMDAEGIAKAIFEILSDQEKWSELSRNGIRGVRRHYSWSSHVRKYVQHARKYAKQAKPKPFWVTSGKKLLRADRLVITDIDNTLIGDPDSLPELIEHLENRPEHIGFGIATGRRLDSTMDILHEWGVPDPDVLITCVGTELYYGKSLQPDGDWERHIDHRWDPDRIRECIDQIPGMTLQPEEDQRKHKISYFVDEKKWPGKRSLLRHVRESKLPVRVIYSHQQFCDFLPQRASKGLAIWYLANKWGIPMESFLIAGDSGNDEEMLNPPVQGVVVGNYSSELEHLRRRTNIYFAEGAYAAGILEGIENYRFFEAETFPDRDVA